MILYCKIHCNIAGDSILRLKISTALIIELIPKAKCIIRNYHDVMSYPPPLVVCSEQVLLNEIILLVHFKSVLQSIKPALAEKL